MGLMETLKKVLGVDVVSNTNTDTDTDTDTNTNTNSTKKAEVLTKEEAIKLLEKNGYEVSPSPTNEIQEAISFLESQGIKVKKKNKNKNKKENENEKEKENENEKEKENENEKEMIISALQSASQEEFKTIKDILVIVTKMSELSKK